MKIRLTLVAVFCLLLTGVYVSGQGQPQPAKLDVVKLADDLFVIHNAVVPGNTTVLVTNEGVLLVDDKFAIDYDNIVAEVKKITPQPIKYVVNSHYHGDHNLGAGALREAWPAMRIVSTEATKTNMTGTPMEYAKTYDNGYQETLDFARQQYDDPATPAAVKDGWAGFIRDGYREPLDVPALADPRVTQRRQPRANVDRGVRVRVRPARVVHPHRRVRLRPVPARCGCSGRVPGAGDRTSS